ncbi:MAG TPA: response regulator transcription factor, partial [Flexilinea sp.]|nr:response regulator transcription factor [Flexilinea sp.]
MARKVLVIDDTRNIQIMLRDFLESQGFEVEIAGDGIEAFDSIERSQPDLILLDIMMPNMDGCQFISQLRKTSDLPVIMITAKQQEADIVHGFELGADDYITKPFKLRELLMRMRAVLRRSTPREEEKPITIIGDLQLDRSRHKVTLGDEPVELTPLEFFVLDILMDSQG